MKPAGLVRSKYLTHLSKPPQDRLIYRTLAGTQTRRILEIGIGDGIRAERMLELALRFHAPPEIRYTGVDLFEARPNQNPGLTLKQAHRQLGGTGVPIRLIPGDASTALAHMANHIGPVDLVVISADQDDESLARAWFYLPRMLHDDSSVYRQTDSRDGEFERLSQMEIQSRAQAIARTLRRAA